MSKEKVYFPAWRYGPGGQQAIFDHEEQVPEGWVDHPSKLDEADRPKGDSDISGITMSGNTVAADHTRGGNVDINRGAPETHESAGATTGGELGQPGDDNNLTTIPPIDDVDKAWIIGKLNARKIVHNPAWKKQKLYDLLVDSVQPAV